MRKEELAYFEEEEFQEILERYEQAVEQGETLYMDAEDLTDIAEYYMMHNEEEKANRCIGLAVSLHPDAIDPQVFLSRQQLFHENLPEAYRILEGISDQEDREVIFLRFELLLKERKLKEAEDLMWDTLCKLEEDRHFFLYDTADLYFEYGFYEEGYTWADQLVREFPKYRDAKMLLADLQMKLDRFEEARSISETVLKEDAFNQDAWMITAEAYTMQERHEESLEATEYLLAINERHPEAMLTRANNLFYLNRIQESHEQYQQYLATYPDEHTVLYLDGICLSNLERYADARNTLMRALEVSSPDSPERIHIHMQLAYVLSKMGKKIEALEQVEQCKNCPSPETELDFNLARGHILLENEDYEEAEKHFDRAMKESKKPYETLMLIAITLGETGHYKKAVSIFNDLHNSTMEDAEKKTAPYIAFCYLFLNDKENFLKNLKEAIELNPNTTQFLFSQFYPDVPVEQYYEKAKEKLEEL